MPIDSTCKTCGQRLRVDSQHAGQPARCPQCQTDYVVPRASVPTSTLAGSPASDDAAVDQWRMKTAAGQIYGPVGKETLDSWCDQGRIAQQSQLLSTADERWRQAAEVYPRISAARSPRVEIVAASAGADVSTAAAPAPSRGLFILLLATAGFFTCGVPALVAVVLGARDLAAMQTGKMDGSARKQTLLGVVVGVAAILFVLAYIVAVTIFVASRWM